MRVYYYRDGQHIIDCVNVRPEDVAYFESNDIKVSMEELNNEFIVYGCPFSDDSEESEVIVFANGRSCEDTMAELAVECRASFG